MYTPLCTKLGQNPIPAKKHSKTCDTSENYFKKYAFRCSVVTSMFTPPTRNQYFFIRFLDASRVLHTFFIDFRCHKTIENASYIYNFSKQVCISLQRGDIDVCPSHANSLLFILLNVSRVLHTFFLDFRCHKTIENA